MRPAPENRRLLSQENRSKCLTKNIGTPPAKGPSRGSARPRLPGTAQAQWLSVTGTVCWPAAAGRKAGADTSFLPSCCTNRAP